MAPRTAPDQAPRPGTEPLVHDADRETPSPGRHVGILLCHGFTGSPASLRPWAEHLVERGLSVRLPLLPGHGTRWEDMNATSWSQWYAEVETALRELETRCDDVVVAGLSMGGCLAALLAARRPQIVRGVVLVNPAFRVDDRRLRALPLLKSVLPSLPGIGNDISKPGQDELCYDRIPLRALHSQTRLWATTIAELPALQQPVLLFQSRHDHVVPRSSTDLFLARVGSTDVTEVVLEVSFHVATLDHDADRIVALSDAFIERVTS